MIRLAAIFLIATFAAPSKAEITVTYYYQKKARGENAFIAAWMDGLVTGLSWANTHALTRTKTPLFCPPSHHAMGADAAIEMFERFLPRFMEQAKGVPREHIYVGAVLLYALRDAFPCNKPKAPWGENDPIIKPPSWEDAPIIKPRSTT